MLVLVLILLIFLMFNNKSGGNIRGCLNKAKDVFNRFKITENPTESDVRLISSDLRFHDGNTVYGGKRIPACYITYNNRGLTNCILTNKGYLCDYEL